MIRFCRISVELLEQSRRLTARSINAIMTATYWEIGRRIVEIEQKGEERAEYGERTIKATCKRFNRVTLDVVFLFVICEECVLFMLNGKFGRHCLPNLRKSRQLTAKSKKVADTVCTIF